jgi:hypothetical protein
MTRTFLWCNMGSIENHISNNSLPSCYLVTTQSEPKTYPCNSFIVACIHCRENVFMKPSPTNERMDILYWAFGSQLLQGYIQIHRLIAGIYKVRCWNGLWCHNIHTKFYTYWFRSPKVNRGEIIDLQSARR